MNNVNEKWHLISKIYGLNKYPYLYELLSNLIFSGDAKELKTFYTNMLRGDSYNFGQGFFISMPKELIEDDEFNGCIIACVNRFDDNLYLDEIPIVKYFFFIKLALMFYSNEIKNIENLDNYFIKYTIVEADLLLFVEN